MRQSSHPDWNWNVSGKELMDGSSVSVAMIVVRAEAARSSKKVVGFFPSKNHCTIYCTRCAEHRAFAPEIVHSACTRTLKNKGHAAEASF
jgi:hypothetical protein